MIRVPDKNKCHLCEKTFLTQEDLNYHWLSHDTGALSQEDRNYLWLKQHGNSQDTQKPIDPPPTRRSEISPVTPKRSNVKHPDGPQNQVHDDKKESVFDGSRDYFNHFREQGSRLGSHPMHDDYGDESIA